MQALGSTAGPLPAPSPDSPVKLSTQPCSRPTPQGTCQPPPHSASHATQPPSVVLLLDTPPLPRPAACPTGSPAHLSTGVPEQETLALEVPSYKWLLSRGLGDSVPNK